jgi:hypothetical protein
LIAWISDEPARSIAADLDMPRWGAELGLVGNNNEYGFDLFGLPGVSAGSETDLANTAEQALELKNDLGIRGTGHVPRTEVLQPSSRSASKARS